MNKTEELLSDNPRRLISRELISLAEDFNKWLEDTSKKKV